MADTLPKFRERLWSQECKEADPTPEDHPTYEFSNGRKFKEPGTSNPIPLSPTKAE